MKTTKNLIVFSLFASILFSANITFTNGRGAAIGLGVGLGTVALGSSIAASNAAARDREYARWHYEEARRRDIEAARRERAAERRHRERMAAMQGQYPVQNPYPVRNQYPTNENYYGGATTISVEE